MKKLRFTFKTMIFTLLTTDFIMIETVNTQQEGDIGFPTILTVEKQAEVEIKHLNNEGVVEMVTEDTKDYHIDGFPLKIEEI